MKKLKLNHLFTYIEYEYNTVYINISIIYLIYNYFNSGNSAWVELNNLNIFILKLFS